MRHCKVLLACVGSLTAVAITSIVTGYNHGIFESLKSAILIIAGYAIGKAAEKHGET